MYKALRIDDIVREIFTYLQPALNAPEQPSPEDTQTLLNAALVCKHFSTHGLDALWSVLYDLRPLLDLIPNTQIVDFDGIEPGGSEEIILNNALCKEDLHVFERYSSRVKAYREDEDCDWTVIRMSVMQELLHCLGRQYLLPKLRILSISQRLRPYHHNLFNPSLKWLLFNPGTTEEAPSLLFQLARTAPHLEHIGLHPKSFGPDSYSILKRFSSLKSLDSAGHISISPGYLLSTFSFAVHLVSLKVSSLHVSERTAAEVDMGSSIPELPLLERLEISDTGTPSSISSVLANLALPHLTVFEFCAGPSWMDMDHRKGCLAVFTRLFDQKSSLRHLVIDATRNMMNKRGTFDVNYLLQSAIPQDLETFEIRIPMLQALHENSIVTIARVFPHLTKMALALPHNELLSFLDLAALTHRMPKIVHLDISIDGGVETNVDSSVIPLCSHRLQELCISGGVINDPVFFARCIDRIFPFSAVSRGTNPRLVSTSEVSKVTRALQMMRECRNDDLQRLHNALMKSDLNKSAHPPSAHVCMS